jgi:hypothetical protein
VESAHSTTMTMWAFSPLSCTKLDTTLVFTIQVKIADTLVILLESWDIPTEWWMILRASAVVGIKKI